MDAEYPNESDRQTTAVHEAGHALLQSVTGIRLKSVSIVPNFDAMETGYSQHAGEYGDCGRRV